MYHIKTIADTEEYEISTRLLMQIALQRGYDVSYFPSSPSTLSGITRCEKDGWEFFFKSTCTSLVPAFGVHAAENKNLTHSLLTGYGVNTPVIVAITPQEDASMAAKMLHKYKRLVVKPVQMNHGDGVTVNVTTLEGLEEAIAYARGVSDNGDVIVQQQVEGQEYRFLVVSGKVLAVVHRRHRGGEAIDVTDSVSPALKQMAVAAAKSCFLGIAGVDIITPDIAVESVEDSYVIEVNLTPGIGMHQFPSRGQPRDVATPIFNAIEKTARPIQGTIKHLGRAERVSFPELSYAKVPARIDTGARTAAIWVSRAEEENGTLHVVFFGPESPFYTGEVVPFRHFERVVVTTSTGQAQLRFKVRLQLKVKGKTIRGWFTLADRSTQVYPVLIGRNVLMGKFIVDVKDGRVLTKAERARTRSLQSLLNKTEE